MTRLLLRSTGPALLLFLVVCSGLLSPERGTAHPAGPAESGNGWSERLSVTVEGVEGAALENVLATLTIYQRRDEDLTAGDIRRMHDGAEEEIHRALEPFGHYQPVITAELTQHDDDEWEARYEIDPGPPVRLAEVDLQLEGEGADDPALWDAVAAFPLGEGDALDHGAYEEGRMRLESVAAERGYFDATFTERRVPVDLTTNTARIILHYRTGERYRFGPVRFEQDEFTEDLLEGFIPFDRGDPFLSREVMEFQNGLAGTGFFRSVDVDVRPQEATNGEVPIVVTLVPVPRTEYNAGAGYGTDTGPRGSFGWEVRRLNRHGHQLDGELRASFTRRDAATRYVIPFGGPGDRITFTLGYRDDDLATHRSRSLLLRAAVAQDRWGWRETLSLNFHRSWFRVGVDEGITTLVLPEAEWSRVRADDRFYPRRGYSASFTARATDPALGSHVSFQQGTVRGRLIRPAGAHGRVLTRLALGTTRVDEFALLPGQFRYFAGGDRSIRGFGYQGLGARGPEGEVLGGRHLMVGSVEYEHLIGESWGVAIFYDAGNAVNALDDGIEQGAGLGGRWLSPIGMARVDVATALSRSGVPLRLHLTLGPDL